MSDRRILTLDTGWTARSALVPEGIPMNVPGTAASALRDRGLWSFDDQRDLEADDWWFATRFEAEPLAPGERAVLRLGGIATLAEVWLNGERLLTSESMFVEHRADVTARLATTNTLSIRCPSLTHAMETKRPRPRWRTRLVDRQDLRWIRTSLLGRMPGWTPLCPAIGPYRPVTLERSTHVLVERAEARVRLDGDCGVVALTIDLSGDVRSAVAVLGDVRAPLAIEPRIHGEVRLPNAPRWWPHTHGAQPRVPLHVELTAGGQLVRIELGEVAFRTIDFDTRDGAFIPVINGVHVFCRGAVWTPLDVVSLHAPATALDEALDLARDAGMNMLRVGGTMTYEDARFHEGCDARGILVWQDFMFANMDYPAGDPAFDKNVRREATELLDRLETSPSLAVLCGGSEIEQQAAMIGQPRAAWQSPLFTELLPGIARAVRPDVIYLPSSPTGGALPFQVSTGVSHYYGVGAYLRPPEDARRAEVRFAAECLAFSNVPVQRTVDRLLGNGERAPHHPTWKARVPRDRGAGWDFEDVRDHYHARLFRADPLRQRYGDVDRYLALARVVSGELMLGAFAEWRRRRSTCAGALVWMLRDVWPGAGWGVIDAHGWPKAAYHYLKRAMAPVALFLTDEGQSGLACHLVNDGPTPLAATLAVQLYRDGEVLVARGSADVEVGAQDAVEIMAGALFDGFVDTSYAYRFGPPAFDVVVATFAGAEAFHFPLGLPHEPLHDLGLTAIATPRGDGSFALTVRTARFAYAVSIDAGAYLPDDDAFHLAPGGERTVRLRSRGAPGARLAGAVRALNGRADARITVASGAP